jgi:hypothetical protein
LVVGPVPRLDAVLTEPSEVEEGQRGSESCHHAHVEGEGLGCGLVGDQLHKARQSVMRCDIGRAMRMRMRTVERIYARVNIRVTISAVQAAPVSSRLTLFETAPTV